MTPISGEDKPVMSERDSSFSDAWLHRRLRVASIVVVVAALGYLGLSLWAGWRDVLASVEQAGMSVILGMLLLSLVNYALRWLRWQHYLKQLGSEPPAGVSAQIYFAGFALTVTPGKVGELLRGIFLKPYGLSLAASTAAFFAERAVDLLAIALLSSLVLGRYSAGETLIVATLVGVLAVIVFVRQERWLDQLARWSEQHPARWASSVARVCHMMVEFRRCFATPTMLYALTLGLLAWGAEALAFYWLLHALGQPLDVPMAVFIYAFAMLAGALSFLPGGLGGSELVMIGLLAWQGMPESAAVTATLITRLATLWFAVALGALALTALLRLRRRLR